MTYYAINMMDGDVYFTFEPPSKWKDNRLSNETDLIFFGVELTDIYDETVILNTDLIVSVRVGTDGFAEEAR